MPIATNINQQAGTAGGRFNTDDFNLLQSVGLDPTTIDLSNAISGLDHKGRVTGLDNVSMATTFGATTGRTAAGTEFAIPAFTSSANRYEPYRAFGGHSSYLKLDEAGGSATMGENMVEYTAYVRNLREIAEAEDIQRGIDATVAGTKNIVDQSAAGQRVYVDEQTVSPEETGQFFDDLGVMTDGGDFYGHGVSATQQQSALDTYGFENVGTDAGELDATVQGQVQIRSDITGATATINETALSMALSLLDGMGIDSSTLIPEFDEINGVTVYKTPEGKDVSSLISTLGSTIQQKIDDSSAAQMAALGYGGTDQPTLFTDLAAIKSAVDAGPDLSDVQTLSQEDISGALASQFTSLAGDISGVSGQVTGVQDTVDAVETAVGTLDATQQDMVKSLADLGVDTEAIIEAVAGVQAAVDPLGGQITSAAQGVRQDIAAQGGTVEGLFGAQTQALGGGASAAAVQQVAGDLQGLKSAQQAQTETLGDLATEEGQTAVKQLVQDVKSSASDIDTAIKDNVLPEFDDIFEIFDDQGKLITEINTETGKIVSSVAPNGDVIIDRLTAIDTAVDTGFGGIDLTNLDESSALTTLTNAIDNAASTFTADYSSMETNIDNDRVAVLKAIQEDSTALDTFLSTRLPTVITTEFGDYELKVGENNEALVTKIDQAVDLTTIESTVADIKAGNIATLGELNDSEITALANAVNYDATSLLSSIEASSLSADDLTALSTLTSDDITNAVDLSGVATATQVGGVAAATVTAMDIPALLSDIQNDNLDADDLADLSRLTVDDLPTPQEVSDVIGYQPQDLLDKINLLQPEVLDEDDLAVLSRLDEDDLSGLATSAQVGQVDTAVQGQAVSLGNIDNIKGDVTTLLSKAEQDLQNNTERDKQISESRADVLQAVKDTLSSNKDAMSLLLNKQTIDIQGDLGSYRVGLDSATGKLTAEAINSQTLALGDQIDTATGQLKTDAQTNTNFLEQQVLNARDAVNNKVGTAFDAEGELIANSVAANGDEIQRVLDAEGVLTETIIDADTNISEIIKTDLSALVTETGQLNATALAIASDTGDIMSLQQLFDAQGKLVREDIDELGRDVIREIDRSGRFVNEAYYQDGYLVEEKQLRIDEIFKKLFPTDPLASPEELSSADRRFLQGFRTEGLMSPY